MRPKPPTLKYRGKIDPEIRPLLAAMNSPDRLVTQFSCCGHGKQGAYVMFAVRGFDGVKDVVEKLNRIEEKLSANVRINLEVVWESWPTRSGRCFQTYPEWLCLTIRILTPYKLNEAVSTATLRKIAKLWAVESKRPAPEVICHCPSPNGRPDYRFNGACYCGKPISVCGLCLEAGRIVGCLKCSRKKTGRRVAKSLTN